MKFRCFNCGKHTEAENVSSNRLCPLCVIYAAPETRNLNHDNKPTASEGK